MTPGILIALVTFPGVIVHEAARMRFCRLRRVAVFDACFFRLGNPAGYINHGPAKDFNSTFLISAGPLIVNSLLCVAFCLPAFAPVVMFGKPDPLSCFLIWIGVSIGMHAFPPAQDATDLWRSAKEAARRGQLFAIASFPLVALIYAANLLRFFWFDSVYGVAIGLGLPALLLRRLA